MVIKREIIIVKASHNIHEQKQVAQTRMLRFDTNITQRSISSMLSLCQHLPHNKNNPITLTVPFFSELNKAVPTSGCKDSGCQTAPGQCPSGVRSSLLGGSAMPGGDCYGSGGTVAAATGWSCSGWAYIFPLVCFWWRELLKYILITGTFLSMWRDSTQLSLASWTEREDW